MTEDLIPTQGLKRRRYDHRGNLLSPDGDDREERIVYKPEDGETVAVRLLFEADRLVRREYHDPAVVMAAAPPEDEPLKRWRPVVWERIWPRSRSPILRGPDWNHPISVETFETTP